MEERIRRPPQPPPPLVHIDYRLESEASNVPGIPFVMAKRSVSEVFPGVNGPAALSTFRTFVEGGEKREKEDHRLRLR